MATPNIYNPSQGNVVVAKGTTLGNATSSLFVIQTQQKVYVGASLQACRDLLKSHEPGPVSVLAAGPASYGFRVYLAKLFDQLGFFE